MTGDIAAAERAELERRVATLEAQVALLMQFAVTKGDATINQARATLGLPDFPLPAPAPQSQPRCACCSAMVGTCGPGFCDSCCDSYKGCIGECVDCDARCPATRVSILT